MADKSQTDLSHSGVTAVPHTECKPNSAEAVEQAINELVPADIVARMYSMRDILQEQRGQKGSKDNHMGQ